MDLGKQYENKGRLLLQQGRIQEAKCELRKGEAYGNANCTYALGCIESDTGRYHMAAIYWQIASHRGSSAAAHALGHHYDVRHSYPKHLDPRALKYYSLAMQRQNPRAAHNLAVHFNKTKQYHAFEHCVNQKHQWMDRPGGDKSPALVQDMGMRSRL